MANNHSWIVAVVTRVSEKSQTTADLIIGQGHHPQKPPAFAELKGGGFRDQQKSVLPPHGVAISSRIRPAIAATALLVNVNGTQAAHTRSKVIPYFYGVATAAQIFHDFRIDSSFDSYKARVVCVRPK